MGEILCWSSLPSYLATLLVLLPHWFIGRAIDSYWSIVPAPTQFVKAYSRTAEKCTLFCAALEVEYVFPVHRDLLESGRGILEQYWRVLYSRFKIVSDNYYLSNMFLPEPLGKRKLQQLVREIQKPVKVLSQTPELLIFVNKFEFYLVARSL